MLEESTKENSSNETIINSKSKSKKWGYIIGFGFWPLVLLIIGGLRMSKENKVRLSDFIQGDRFELNSYLTYLFNYFYSESSYQTSH